MRDDGIRLMVSFTHVQINYARDVSRDYVVFHLAPVKLGLSLCISFSLSLVFSSLKITLTISAI